MATSYGLDGRGASPGKGKVFVFTVALRTPLGYTQPLIKYFLGFLSPGVKPPGREADLHPVPRSTVLELYLHFHHMSSWLGA
jgi:hypothetical protein